MSTLTAFEKNVPFLSSLLHRGTAYVFTRSIYWMGLALHKFQKGRTAAGPLDEREVKSILITRVDGLGDLVLVSSLLREVRRHWRKAHITLVVDKRFLSFVEHSPYADEVIGFNEEGSKYKRLFVGPWRALQLSRKQLWQRRFDLAINPRWDIDSRHATIIGYFSLARHHLGFSETVSERKRHLNYGFNRFFTQIIPSKAGTRHETERNAEVLHALGICNINTDQLELALTEADWAYAQQILAQNGVNSGDLLFCLGVGATEAKRRWPIERFAYIAEWLHDKFQAKFLVVGDSVDACNAEQMRSILGSTMINQAGVCNIRQSAALIAFCNGYLGNDSGPMHLAAASNVPVIELSCHPEGAPAEHINSPVRYAPITDWLRIIQPKPLHPNCMSGCSAPAAHCILNIHPHEVKKALNELIGEQISRKSMSASAGD